MQLEKQLGSSIFLLTVVAFILGAIFLLSDSFSFIRWDNFEYFIPTYWFAHSEWWSGTVPYINPYQNMSEPVLANAQSGAFSPIYFLLVGVSKLFGLGMDGFGYLTAILHFFILALGLRALYASFGIQNWAANLATVGFCFSGYFFNYAQVWLHVLVEYSWAVWFWWGLKNNNNKQAIWIVPFSLWFLITSGHPQNVFMIALNTLMFLPLIDLTQGRLQKLVLVTLGIILSIPYMYESYFALQFVERASPLTAAQINEYSLPDWALISMIGPFIFELLNINNADVFYSNALSVAPVGFVIIYALKAATRLKTFLVTILVIFLFLAMSEFNWLGSVVDRLPIFNMFRWPHKYTPHINITLALLVGLALTQLDLNNFKERMAITILGGALWISLLIVLINNFSLQKALSLLGVAFFVLAPWLRRKNVSLVLFAVSFCLNAIATGIDSMNLPLLKNKSYNESQILKNESDGAQLEGGRYLVIGNGACFETPCNMEQSGLFHGATRNEEHSLLGHRMALTPKWVWSTFGSTIEGTIPYEVARPVLNGLFLTQFGVAWLIIDPAFKKELAGLAQFNNWKFEKQIGRQMVYKNITTGLEVFVPKHVVSANPENYKQWFSRGARESIALIDSRNVDQEEYDYYKNNKLIAESIHKENGSFKIMLNSSTRGYLVLSHLYLPQYEAWANSKKLRIDRVNGAIMGVGIKESTPELLIKYSTLSVKLILPTMLFAWISILILYMRRIRSMPYE